MKTIILPGYSPHNKEWAEEVKNKLQLDHEILVHEWRHWLNPDKSLSLRYETEKILEKIGKDNVNIIAKSVGTRVLVYLIPQVKDNLEKVILCGIPTKFQSEDPKKLYSKGLSLLSPSHLIIFQNSKDPLANYSVIKKFIHSVNPRIKVVEKPRSDHTYPFFNEFGSFLNNSQ